MSLLSETRGRPDRVRSLLNLLKSGGGSLSQREITEWLLPPSLPGMHDQEREKDTMVTQTLGVTRSLGLIQTDGKGDDALDVLQGDYPEDHNELSDLFHEILIDPPATKDDVLFEAFSAWIIFSERLGMSSWITKANADLTDEINRVLKTDLDKDRVFNSSKYAPWRDWMVYLGMGWEQKSNLIPHPTYRLERELPKIGRELGFNKQIDAHEFLRVLALRMPYCDRGRIFQAVSEKMKWVPQVNQISGVLSAVLRELHGDGLIELHQFGDVGNVPQLAVDKTSRLNFFNSVTIKSGSPS